MDSTPDDDNAVASLQSSTKAILQSFKSKANSLSSYSDQIKVLLREGYDVVTARRLADSFFGSKKISFIAIDGTESQDQELDMLLFYSGAFAYHGQLEFVENGCKCGEVAEVASMSDISAAIPIHEDDASIVVGQETEGGMEADPERLPSSLMHFAEYYLAVKLLMEHPELKLIILDRTLAGDIGHLIWSISDFIKEGKCILQGLQTEFGNVSALDLELVRILQPNIKLEIPAPRSQFLKYSAINFLLSAETDKKTYGEALKEILTKIGGKNDRLTKITNDISLFNKEYSFLKSDFGNGLAIEPRVKQYWQRVFSATLEIAKNIFEPRSGKHPLVYEQLVTNNDTDDTKVIKKWITATDLEYMTLVMVYALLRLAWEKNVLVIGLIKDTAASELIKTVVPILRNVHKIKTKNELPKFNSDKQLLQTFSVTESKSIKAPWRTFEFDACFRTIVPDDKIHTLRQNQINVKGAYKNVISGERMFVKSYIQLWQSQNDVSVRGHVFSYDRPCYPVFDKPGELLLFHKDDNVIEEISPMIHFDKDAEISHLVMDILCSMAKEVIPECLGHNYPLFLADKKAKYILGQMRTNYLSTVAYEMANSELDQQVLYQRKFRDFRSDVESSRRSRK